ncbi:MAG: sulfatase-like hydrolase/transferase [Planctomycetales bacterium]|nr:sulfatase-like hydrolase/transferase [Planctomycetales bacterium]
MIRSFVNSGAAISIAFAFAVAASGADRPNIVWVSCEDISPHLGCYGDPHATTPNIDQLASEGVMYSHAFVPAGVCAPCRSTIITGMYQTTIGTQHMRCKAKLPDSIQPFTIALRNAGYYCTNNSKKDYQFNEPKQTWDESSGKAHWRNRKTNDQPFFSVFNFTECHESGIANDEKYDRVTRGIAKHDPNSLTTLPTYYPDTPTVRADWGRYYDVVTAMDQRVGQIITQLKEDGLCDDTIVIYWSDHGVGLPRAKRWLYDSGMRVPLVVRVPEKWQQHAPGERGSTTDRLVSLIDLGPTMLNLAGLTIPQDVQGQPFLGPNLPHPREYVFGARDRMDERYDIIRAVRDHRYKYIRNYEPLKTYYQYMNTAEKGRLMQEIRRVAADDELPDAAKLFMASTKPVEELYDTQVDPHEINNLAADPSFQSVLERMRGVHMDWVLETKDLGLIPEPEIARREAKLGSSYAILRQPGAETLIERVRDAAALSLTGADSLDGMLKATHDTDAAVRYWGAIGIGNLGATASTAKDRMHELLIDASIVVRVAASRALCRMNEPDDALPVLVDSLKNGQQWERLHAIIVLDEINEMARPVIDEMKLALNYRDDLVAKGKYTVRVANRALNELLGTDNRVD